MIKSNSGGISIFIIASLVVLLAIATISLMIQPNSGRYSFNIHNAMKLIKSNLELNLNDAQGWAYTVADTTNTSASCLRDHTDCFSLVGTKSALVNIRDTVDGLFLGNLNSTTQGINLASKSCTNFNATDGNSTCPVKVVATWTPICAASPCVDPPVLIEVSFDHSPAKNSGPKIDLSKYNFTLQK